MNYRIRIYFILLSIIFSFSLNAQKVYVTNSGQSIIISPNGKWDYTKASNSDLGDELFTTTNVVVDPYELPADSKYAMTSQEEEMYLELNQQLMSLEIDYFVRYIIINNRNSNKASKEDKKLEKDLKSRYEKASKLIKELKKVKSSDIDKRQKIILRIKKQLRQEFRIDSKKEMVNQPKPEVKSVNLASFEIDKRTTESIIYNDNCKIIFDGFDKQINKTRKETSTGKWFSYTHPKLMSYFKENDFLKVESSVLKVDNKTFLNLKLTLSTKDAKRSYGLIEENAMMRIQLINGDKVYLNNQIRSEGSLEAYTGNTIYHALYMIKKDDLKELEKTEVDKVGLMWSSGFEEYDVYEVDFILNQIKCLKN